MSQARRTRRFAPCAKRVRSAKRGEEKKIKRLLPVHCSGSSHVHYMNDAFQLVTRCSGMFAGNKITVMHSCSFDDAVREAFRLFRNVPGIKEKQKKCLNL